MDKAEKRAESVEANALKAVEDYKKLATFKVEVTEALVVIYHYCFNDYKEEIMQIYLNLYLSGIVIIEEDIEESEIWIEDVNEAPTKKIAHPAPKEASTEEAVYPAP